MHLISRELKGVKEKKSKPENENAGLFPFFRQFSNKKVTTALRSVLSLIFCTKHY